MAMADWRSLKRRHYTMSFKRQILAEAAVAGVSVSSVARRHGLNANLIFNWRRRLGAGKAASFVPAVIVPDVFPSDTRPIDRQSPGQSRGGRMEVVCLGGRRIVVDADFDAAALGRLLALVEA